MNTQIIQKKTNEIKIKNTISSKKIEKKITKELFLLKKKICINGFRKGKAPNQLIEKKFRNDVLNMILKKSIKKHLKNVIKQKKIKKYSNIEYFLEKYKKGQDFNYTLKFHIISNKLKKKIKSIKIYKLKIKIQKSDIIKTILNFQKNIIPWTTKKDFIKKNDKITFEYEILTENKKTILKKKKKSILMNKNYLFKKIYKFFLNKKINDKFKIQHKFSKYHPEKKIAGKKTILIIKIKKIQEKTNKNIDFKIIKKFGIQEKNLKELKKNILKILKVESNKISQTYLKNQFIKKWIKKNYEEISAKKITKEIKLLYKKNLLEYKKYTNIFDKKYNENLKNKCKIKLIIQNLIHQIITEESLFVSKKSIKKFFYNIQKKLSTNKMLKNKKVKKKDIMNEIKNHLLVEKTFNFIFKNVSLQEKKTNFIQALKKNRKIEKTL
ncbi:trigger factor [Buchnera aphidicola]|uniref:trigger factor n=1 Tax=Buchnera aphidicola TaxID=9 RepID=UPI0034639560